MIVVTDTFRPTSFRDKCCLLLLLLLPGLQQVAIAAPLLSLDFDSLGYESLELKQVSLRIDHAGNDKYRFKLSAGQVRLPQEQVLSHVSLECQATLTMAQLDCHEGWMQFEHATLGVLKGRLTFAYDFSRGLRQAKLEQVKIANGHVTVSLNGPAPSWRLNADVSNLELKSLRPFFSLAGISSSALETLTGKVSGSIGARGWPLVAIQAEASLSDVNYSAASVAQAASGKVHIDLVKEHDDWQGEANLLADSGEFYLVPPLPNLDHPPGFYIAIDNKPLTLHTVFSYNNENSTLVVQDMDYVHPSVLALNLAGKMQLVPEFNLEGLSLRIPETPLAEIYPVYLQPWLIDTPYNDLAVDGDIALEVGISQGDIKALALKLHQADIVDERQRFAVNVLSTDLQMTEQRQHASRLSWDSLDIYRIGLGPGAIELASQDFNIEVTKWQDVPLLDGKLRIEEFDLYEVGQPDFELHMAGAVESVSLPSLTTALDWPLLGGTLSGDFSGLSYSHGDMHMDGELLVSMFGGRVTIRDLNVRDLFGNLPVLSADVGVQAIDLEQLTETFAFGKITGKLGGYIRGLKLENWRPVAFDAKLSTQDDDDTRHRISQKALNNLSQIGGGLRGALSRGFLAYFDEYSYGELGVSCRLANGFCELGGVETYEQGHYLLTPGGVLPPWVQVKLAGSVIAWDALIQGFEQIAQGEVKIN